MPTPIPSFGQPGGAAGKAGGALGKARAKYVKGKQVGHKSRTGRTECSDAMSTWKTSGMTSAVAATLGKCRAAAHAKKQGDLHAAAGNELKAASLHHRATKDVVGKGARLAKARELMAARAAKAGAPAGQPQAHAAAPTHASAMTAAQHRAEANRHEDVASKHGKTVKAFEAFTARGKAPGKGQREAYDRAKSAQITARHEAAHHHAKANAMEAGAKVAATPHVPTVAAPTPHADPLKRIKDHIAAHAPVDPRSPGELAHAKRYADMPHDTRMAEARRLGIRDPHKEMRPVLTARLASAAHQQDMGTGERHTSPRVDPGEFGRRVKAAASTVGPEGRFAGGSKVYISHAHAAYEKAHGPMPIDQFKRHLADAHSGRHIDMAQADMVEAMDRTKLNASRVSIGGSTTNRPADFHFVRAEHSAPAKVPAPTASVTHTTVAGGSAHHAKVKEGLSKIFGSEGVDDRGMTIKQIASRSGIPEEHAAAWAHAAKAKGIVEYDHFNAHDAEHAAKFATVHRDPDTGKPIAAVRIMRPKRLAEMEAGAPAVGPVKVPDPPRATTHPAVERAREAAKQATQTPAASATHTYGSLAHVDTAFDRSHGASQNFVKLHEFRAKLGGTREQQDAVIRSQRMAGRLSLDSHEGLHGSLTQAERDAGIHEGGSKYIYISRRD